MRSKDKRFNSILQAKAVKNEKKGFKTKARI